MHRGKTQPCRPPGLYRSVEFSGLFLQKPTVLALAADPACRTDDRE